MKKKIVLSSVLSIVLCLSLIVGSTFALFTSEDKTNIAINAGNVEVVADITLEKVYSPKELDSVTGYPIDAANSVDPNGNAFQLGGKVTVATDGSITLDQIAPGDKAWFKVTMTNKSTVALIQRMLINCISADKTLFDQLIVGVSENLDNGYTYYTDFSSAWETNAAVYGSGDTAVRYISIELPGYVGNVAEKQTCQLSVNVMAVQGNASFVNADDPTVYTVDSQTALNDAIALVKDADTILVTKPNLDLSIAFTGTKTITLRGYVINQLTLDAVDGTFHIYNDVNDKHVINAASHSVYVYGKVQNLTVEQGRVVVENTANIQKVELAPQTPTSTVTLEVAELKAPTVAPVVEAIVVNAAAAATGATVVVAAPKATTAAPVVPTLPTITATADSVVKVEDVTVQAVTESGSVPFITSQDELNAAIAAAEGGKETVLVLGDGTYNLPGIGSAQVPNAKIITFVGTENAVIDLTGGVPQVTGCTFTFDGVTVKFSTGNYQGFQHAAKIVYKNCTIYGQQTMYGAVAEFVDCHLINTESYNVWTYGANDVTFTDCTFTTGGRAILIYNEKTTASFVANVTLNNCKFIDDGTYVDAKAAVETGSNANNTATGNKYNIEFNNCTYEGFETNKSTSPLWGNKNSMDQDHLNVVIDGADVY